MAETDGMVRRMGTTTNTGTQESSTTTLCGVLFRSSCLRPGSLPSQALCPSLEWRPVLASAPAAFLPAQAVIFPTTAKATPAGSLTSSLEEIPTMDSDLAAFLQVIATCQSTHRATPLLLQAATRMMTISSRAVFLQATPFQSMAETMPALRLQRNPLPPSSASSLILSRLPRCQAQAGVLVLSTAPIAPSTPEVPACVVVALRPSLPEAMFTRPRLRTNSRRSRLRLLQVQVQAGVIFL
mmetsp:Transcript_83705/g.175087  ORF Transcript_83705/g.175087 Transcript_83705/m.175087 type:complete len:240 (-) Transcript_83705:718-1437(-)